MEFGVWGLGFGGWGLEFGVWGCRELGGGVRERGGAGWGGVEGLELGFEVQRKKER